MLEVFDFGVSVILQIQQNVNDQVICFVAKLT